MNLPPLFTGAPSANTPAPDPLAERRQALRDLDQILDRFDSRRRDITPFKDAMDDYARKSAREGFRMSPGLRRRLKMFEQELKHIHTLPELRDFAQSFSQATSSMEFHTKSFWRSAIRALSKRTTQLQKASPVANEVISSSKPYKFNWRG